MIHTIVPELRKPGTRPVHTSWTHGRTEKEHHRNPGISHKKEMDMKRIVTLLATALMVLSFSMVVLAEEKVAEKAATEKTVKKEVKKDKKEVKKNAAKPAKKVKKEMAGC